MKQPSALRRYPPLTAALIATLIAVFVLPSALNVPQSSPTQTLEFAPVPPQDDAPPPPDGGNVGSLGLGSSSSAPSGAAPGGEGAGLPPPPPIPGGAGERPVTKRCVGSPPRQTEDPLSPPCVAHFDGDNGGATYQGVTGEEITILFYLDTSAMCQGCPAATGTGRGSESAPRDTYVDLWTDEQPDDFIDTRALRRFQNYFNDRFQTYGRRAHFWIYYHRGADSNTPEGRRADAIANYEELRPFAAFSYVASYPDDYLQVMADKGVLNFGSRLAKSAEFFLRTPGLVWSYPPTLEQQADNFAAYVCRSVIGQPAVAAGDIDGDGQADADRTRRLGMLYAEDEGKPNLAQFAQAVRQRVEACGGEFVETRSFPQANAFESTENRTVATQNMAVFQTQGVTTIVWPGGYENEHSKMSRRIGYYPEWLVAGDNQIEGFGPGMFQDQDVWHRHAWTVAPMAAVSPVEQRPCYLALTEADQSMSDGDRSYTCGLRTFYEDLRQMFTGIQVAGPKLAPRSVDQGFHAIPPHLSANPDAPACFYLPGDYTCVKDGTVGWWDRDATNGEGLDGCYRLVEGGRRHTATSWPEGRGLLGDSPDDPCMTFQGGVGAGRTVTG
ncbi:MAG TPA: hypothetical protein VGA69_10435 [Nitriliruptorales bacterium]